MGVEAAPGNKSKGSSIVKGSTDPKNPPTNPPVRQFANQLQQDIEDVTVEYVDGDDHQPLCTTCNPQ
ncbi:hypothetical protein OUZ56_005373 [Daphnia magna]|uniref:Uncharacterized protein n=1 Tax=Daphnia magna TaxID=35525 RepID=A0ABQ9YSQ1_9CRUS|nr:hypothetical protein OUZ56_005373 [Daphnia magna]